MSELVRKISLSELNTMRARCKRCNVIFEVPAADARGLFASGQCSCGAILDPHGHNPLGEWVKAVDYLTALGKVLEIEFLVPADLASPYTPVPTSSESVEPRNPVKSADTSVAREPPRRRKRPR
jgi:hypothetical protein